jgi:hypothetical protein
MSRIASRERENGAGPSIHFNCHFTALPPEDGTIFRDHLSLLLPTSAVTAGWMRFNYNPPMVILIPIWYKGRLIDCLPVHSI